MTMSSAVFGTTPRSLVAVPQCAAPVRLIVIEAHPVTRIGLLSVLNAERDMMVVGAAADLHTGLELVDEWSPAAVLIDPDLTGTDGPAAVRALLARSPSLRVVALGQHDGDEEIHAILAAGACGYLFKSAPVDEIVAAIRDARAGRTCVSLHAWRNAAGCPT